MGDGKLYAWLDTETTGLKPRAPGAAILEICVVLTDSEMEHVATFYDAIRRGETTSVFQMWLDMWDPEALELHQENGLVDYLRDHKKLPRTLDVERALLSFFDKHGRGDRSVYLAGSSIGFDVSWLEAHMPKVLEHPCLHYRRIDVSSTRVQMEMITGESWEYQKEKKHRAQSDVRETIKEYQWLWRRFRTLCATGHLDIEETKLWSVHSGEAVPEPID